MHTNVHSGPGFSASARTSQGLRTVNQAAEFLAVSRSTLYKLVRDGELRAVTVGARLRFRDLDLDAYLERGRGPVR